MHHKTPKFDNPNLQRYFERAAKRDHHSEHLYRRALHVIERFIATLAILALLGSLVLELHHMFTTGGADRSGMGFTIMESFMDKVTVRSRPGEGTTVVMTRSISRRRRDR